MTEFRINAAILAGGQSRRMGRDKAQIDIHGLPLLERTARLARAVCSSVVVAGRAKPDDWPMLDVFFLEDEAPGEGPLGGLATALRFLSAPPPPPIMAPLHPTEPLHPTGEPEGSTEGGPVTEQDDPAGRPYGVLLLACDLPALTAEALSWLVKTAQERQPPIVDGLVLNNGGQREPLFAVYTPHSLPLIEAQLAAGRRSLQSLIDKGDFAAVELPPELASALINVNTPEDLDAWRQSGERRP